MKDLETKDRFVELRASGRSFASISKEIGVAKSTLISWSREMQNSIANLRQLHLDAVREKHRLGIERRMEIFGNQMNAVEDEIAKRDLSELPTSRLYDILIKLSKEVQGVELPVELTAKSSPMDADFISVKTQWQA